MKYSSLTMAAAFGNAMASASSVSEDLIILHRWYSTTAYSSISSQYTLFSLLLMYHIHHDHSLTQWWHSLMAAAVLVSILKDGCRSDFLWQSSRSCGDEGSSIWRRSWWQCEYCIIIIVWIHVYRHRRVLILLYIHLTSSFFFYLLLNLHRWWVFIW